MNYISLFDELKDLVKNYFNDDEKKLNDIKFSSFFIFV